MLVIGGLMKQRGFQVVMVLLILVGIYWLKCQRIDIHYPNQSKFNQKTQIELDENSFYRFYVLFDDVTLNTSNFIDVLSCLNGSDYKIFYLVLHFDSQYNQVLQSVEIMHYNTNQLMEVRKDVYQKVISKATELQLDSIVAELEIHGAKIRMIGIDTTYVHLKKLLNKYPKLQYGFSPNGLFMKQ